ncbi:MAG: carboxypeptidase regulatory-like domain-containing protein [Elusimicrobia bacterium]|nr:carboxypeptidase regulatory-like domain-containing protein [Elusimicrobiota bacterium]
MKLRHEGSARPEGPVRSGMRESRIARRILGSSMIEVVLFMFVVSVIFLVGVQVFRGVGMGVATSKNKTLAANQAQSHLATLVATGYGEISASSVTAAVPGLTPAKYYDTIQYPPTSTKVGAATFTRYTLVEKMSHGSNGQLTALAASAADEGLKRITELITWRDGKDLRSVELKNIVESPRTDIRLCEFRGVVKSTNNVPLSGASVMGSYSDQRAFAPTDNTGAYTIQVPSGTYVVTASYPGYEPRTITGLNLSFLTSPVTVDFSLNRSPTGVVQGSVWTNPSLVISQVVASTVNSSGFSQEYVEVYNPTTWTWTMPGNVGLMYQRHVSDDPVALPISINYLSNFFENRKFYLFANTSPVVVAGISKIPDAVWDTSVGNPNYTNFPMFAANKNIIPTQEDGSGSKPGVGGVGLCQAPCVAGGPTKWDRVGWGSGGDDPTIVEGIRIEGRPSPGTSYSRISSTSGVSNVDGPAYDMDDNSADFVVSTFVAAPPRNMLTADTMPRTGVPPTGAYVWTNDPLGYPTPAGTVWWISGSASRKTSQFTLTVTTAPQMVAVSAGAFGKSYDPSSFISPTSTGPTTINVSARETNRWAILQGTVKDNLGFPIAGLPVVEGMPSAPGPTDMTGLKLTRADGTITVGTMDAGFRATINQGAAINRKYASSQFIPVGCSVGAVCAPPLVLLPCQATVRGQTLTSGGSPLSGQSVIINPGNKSVISDSNGYYNATVTEGVNTLTSYAPIGYIPPNDQSVTVQATDAGATLAAPPLVFTSDVRTMTGKVTRGGVPLKTGAIVILNKNSILPAVWAPGYAPDLGSMHEYSATRSETDGTYQLNLKVNSWALDKGNLYAYETHVENGSVVTNRTVVSGINISSNSVPTVDLNF